MIRTLASLMLASVGTVFASGCATSQPASSSAVCPATAGCVSPVNDKTADALRETLQDERRVHAFYAGVIARHGDVLPFSNIIHAEQRHANLVESLMQRHGVAVPAPGPIDTPAVPDTVSECRRMAAQFERDNIAMYDRLLADTSEPDIRAAFEQLRSVSRNNHLPAFERTAAAPANPARGLGLGYGRRAGYQGECRGVCIATP